MSKTVRYKLNRSSGGKTRRKKKQEKGKAKSPSFFYKFLKFLFVIFALFVLGYWFFVAYTTVRDIKIKDVIGSESEVVDFVDMGVVRKTLVVYENPRSGEQKTLFLLAVIYNSDSSELLVYHFPRDLYISDFFTNKQISIEDLTYAGNSYMYEEQYAYVIRQIEEQMAIKFDSYIWFGSEVSKNFVSDDEGWGAKDSEVLEIFSKLSFFNLVPKYYKVNCFEENFHSNMSFLEMYSYFQNIRGAISSKKYTYVNLMEKDMIEDITLGSGRNVKHLRMVEVDNSLRENIDLLRTGELSREHVKVEVYNGTEEEGYARFMARKIQNAGCRVIRHENANKTYEKTTVYVSNIQRFPGGLEKVLSVLGDVNVVEGRPDFLTTGDIVVVLGVD